MAQLGTALQQFGQGRNHKSQTLWDRLDLLPKLLIPIVIAAVGWWVSQHQADVSNRIADNQARDTVLDNYEATMSWFLLGSMHLRTHPTMDAAGMARARTLMALDRLDAQRKGKLLEFLWEARIVGRNHVEAIIDLSSANLSGANLIGNRLSFVDLDGARLDMARLKYAHLINANLKGAFLKEADFTQSDLRGAHFNGSNLNGADFTGAQVTDGQLATAKSRTGMIKPDGQVQ